MEELEFLKRKLYLRRWSYRHHSAYLLDELFALFDKKISDYTKIVPLDLWYRFVFSNGDTFDYSRNEDAMKEEIEKFSDEDFKGYKD